MKSEKELNQRGDFDIVVDAYSGINAVIWMDNRPVTLVSTFAAIEPQKKVKRWSSKEKCAVDVPCPNIVLEYTTDSWAVWIRWTCWCLYIELTENHVSGT